MRAASPTLNGSARGCVVLLSLVLGASLAVRAYAYARPVDPGGMTLRDGALPPIDLGAGTVLPRASAGRHHVVAGACPRAALVTFVSVGPYGPDPARQDAPHPADRIAYIYHGWNLGGRFGTIGLNAIYFASKAQARFSTGRNPTTDDLAVKIVVPAGCDASPEDVLATFRKQVTAAD
ncbi:MULTISPECIES: hypothetical protein [unclassified Methylobacterium]|jgi:hypothetical protein|uniref:hypothetical protein n=1 Tax=unclassified Methylobacterium TaxID=2615210 RepID=UPI001355B4FD|nr:hypothetical protein [Methylobacterium sp. 2A]MWV22516.1 hypothetical protein [Methylobacterium sp. 2A]